MTLYHRLKLYEEDGSLSTKKPVVSETYEEVVFSEPHEDFYNRVSNHVKGAPGYRVDMGRRRRLFRCTPSLFLSVAASYLG